MKKYIALFLALIMVCSLCACGKKAAETTEEPAAAQTDAEAAADEAEAEATPEVVGETQTWGNITLFVPENMTLKGGDMFDEDNPDALTITDSSNPLKYIVVTIMEEADIDASMDMTREINAEAGLTDITVGDFAGFIYNSNDYDCSSLKAALGDRFVMINACSFAADDAVLATVAESIDIG